MTGLGSFADADRSPQVLERIRTSNKKLKLIYKSSRDVLTPRNCAKFDMQRIHEDVTKCDESRLRANMRCNCRWNDAVIPDESRMSVSTFRISRSVPTKWHE
jgi:hypothetical protein